LSGPSPDALVREVLAEYGRVTRVRLAEYLRPREPRRHLYSLMADYPRRGGRMLRPSLCIATARAFGADLEHAVLPAVALELLHNAFLVHDDVEDESTARRGRPTLHRLHGVPIAVNVGDALTLVALRALLDSSRELGLLLAMRVLEEAQRTAAETIEGQAIELGWRRDNAVHVKEADYLEMILKKTCWYSAIFPIRAGALIGSRDRADLDRFLRFGFFLGAAFQIQDDVLNLVGDPDAYGKETDGDLWEGKRTLILIHLLSAAGGSERDRLVDILSRSRAQRSEADVRFVRERIDAHGSIEHARRVAHGLAGAAQHECRALFADLPPSRDRAFIEALPHWVLTRA
jgi:geranylgeranyl diphosphate synthase type II